MKHTPGSWRVLPGIYETGLQVKVVPKDHNESSYFLVGGKNMNANARLIAAAPELLEACKNIYGILIEREQGNNDLDEDLNKLEQAIAKAEGKE